MNAKAFIWYSFVVVSSLCLILSYFMKNSYLALISFIIAIILKKTKDKIKFPDLFINSTIISFKNNKKD